MSQRIPIYIPTFISDQNYNPNRVLPRIFFFNGMVDCETYCIESGSLNTVGIIKEVSQFPYFDHYNVITGSFPTSNSDSLLFNNENPVYGQQPTETLYTTYWSSYVELLYNPKTRLIGASAIIPLSEYFDTELNDIVNWRGNYYHLRAINDYNLKTGECRVQLLGPIIADTFGLSSADIITTTTTTLAPTTTTTLAPTTTTTAGPTTTTTAAPCSLTIYFDVSQGGTQGWNSSTDACNGTGTPLTVYFSSTPNGCPTTFQDVFNDGKIIYINSSLTTVLAGNDKYYKSVSPPNSGIAIQVGNDGFIDTLSGPC
jgi:hypothetical protein